MSLRLIFMGTPDFAVPTLVELADRGHDIATVYTRAAKPGGRVIVTDVDWIQFDEQAVPEPFATLSDTLRAMSTSVHGYDGAWGRRLPHAFTSRGLLDVDVRGDVWTMRGGEDSAEWYVAALERALGVLPAEVFPAGLDTRAAIARAREPDFVILSPISVTAVGRRPAGSAPG